MIHIFTYKILEYSGRLISSNEFLYKLWLNYYVSNKKGFKKKIPVPGDDYYFDGYPRSGNTYTKGLLDFVFPEYKGTSHLHSKTGIKIALKNEIQTFIIIRKPEDAVISNVFRKVENGSKMEIGSLCKLALEGYTRYYKYVLNNIDEIKIMRFESVISNQTIFLKNFSKTITNSDLNETDLENKIREFENYMKEKEKNKRNSISSLPNKKRKAFKADHINLLLESKYFSEAESIYDRLTSSDILK